MCYYKQDQPEQVLRSGQYSHCFQYKSSLQTYTTAQHIRSILRTLWCSGLTHQTVIQRAQWVEVLTQQQATKKHQSPSVVSAAANNQQILG